jgi:cytochrome c oxidase assembly protein subunit 15
MISWLHADVVLLFLGLAIAYTLGARLTGSTSAARAGSLLLLASAAQGVIGYLQYFTGVPWPLVALHMLGACLVWLATLEVWLSTRVRG